MSPVTWGSISRAAIGISGFGLLYFLGALLGNLLSSTGTTYVSFWAPGGLYLGVLLLTERRHWSKVALGAALGNLSFDRWSGTSFNVSLVFYVANTLHAVVGAWLIQRFVARRPTLANLRELFGILALGGFIGAALGATLGAAALVLGEMGSNYSVAWQSWWAGTTMATILITPLVLAWFSEPLRPTYRTWRRTQVLEALTLALLIVVSERISGAGHELRLLPLLVWAGVRFGTRGATAFSLFVALALAFIASPATAGVVSSRVADSDIVFTMQVFLGASNFVAVVPAIVLGQHARALASVRDAEERQRTFALATFEGLCITENHRVIDANEQLVALLGDARANVVGRNFIELLARDSPEPHHKPDGTNEGDPPAFPLILRKADGTSLHVEARSRLLNLSSREIRIIAIRDLSERHRAEQAQQALEDQLRQSQKLEAIGTFAGGIAHDLNNMLTAIGGFAELAFLDATPSSDARESMSQLKLAVSRARDLVKNLLTFARRRTPAQVQVDLSGVLRETLMLLRTALPTTVKIETSIADDLPHVVGDATQLQQVLVNLGMNAGHAMHGRQGTLRIDLQTSPSEAQSSPSQSVRISVSDDGHGMSEETKRHIFEPFFTTKGPLEGTGLGLAVVHGIVKNHGGTITVESEQGVGTTMHVLLPGCHPMQAAPESLSEAPPPRAGLQLLFVDDDKAICGLAERVLKRAGHVAKVCDTPDIALSALRESPARFEVLITDLTMPVMTGIELARQARKISPHLPVILMSGNATGIDAELISNEKINALLEKPMSPSTLIETIARVLANLDRT